MSNVCTTGLDDGKSGNKNERVKSVTLAGSDCYLKVCVSEKILQCSI